MLEKIKNKIESKRGSKKIFWKISLTIKDIVWIIKQTFIEYKEKAIFNLFGKNLIKELTPYEANNFNTFIRLGNKKDGGYVLPKEILKEIDTAYTYGVGDNISFERDLGKKINIPIRLYDHTIEKLPAENKNFLFKREGIGNKKEPGLDTFENHLKANKDLNKKILLKIDIEGNEWKVLPEIIDKFSNMISAIILEVHYLGNTKNLFKNIKILDKLNSKFTLVHIHGNNCGETIKIADKIIPTICEMTLVNNNLINKRKILSKKLPTIFDYPNCPNKKDLNLNFWK